MNKKDLDRKHPELEAQLPLYVEWDDLFKGGNAMESIAKASLYLIRHPFETTKQYEIRLKRATYRNHAAAVVNVFASALADVDRKEVEDMFPDYIADVDMIGSSAFQFFGEVILQATARGAQFVVVDSPSQKGKTQKEEAVSGKRPYMVSVPPWDILDWQIKNGKLEWVKIKQYQEIARQPLEEYSSIEQYKIWFQDRWELWEAQDDVAVLIDKGNNHLGAIPVVPFFFQQQSPMIGVSALNIITGLLKRIFRHDSELDKNLFDSAVEIAVFLGFTETDLAEFVVSGTNGLRSDSESADMKYVAPTGRVYEALRQAINEDEARVREIALRMLKPDSRQVESAESKREDRQQLDSQILRFARSCEASENLCWEYFSRLAGKEKPPVVVYPKDYDGKQLRSELISSFVRLRQTDSISRETLWDILRSAGVLPDDFDPEEEKARIREDMRVSPIEPLLTTREKR